MFVRRFGPRACDSCYKFNRDLRDAQVNQKRSGRKKMIEPIHRITFRAGTPNQARKKRQRKKELSERESAFELLLQKELKKLDKKKDSGL